MEEKDYNVCDIVYIISKNTPTKAGDINKGEVTKYIITEHVILEKIITEKAIGLDYKKDNHRYFTTNSEKRKIVEYRLNDNDDLWTAGSFYDSNAAATDHIKNKLIPIERMIINKNGITDYSR